MRQVWIIRKPNQNRHICFQPVNYGVKIWPFFLKYSGQMIFYEWINMCVLEWFIQKYVETNFMPYYNQIQLPHVQSFTLFFFLQSLNETSTSVLLSGFPHTGKIKEKSNTIPDLENQGICKKLENFREIREFDKSWNKSGNFTLHDQLMIFLYILTLHLPKLSKLKENTNLMAYLYIR